MIVFVVSDIHSRVSNKGRVKVTFYNSREEYSLDISKIKEIFYDGKAFYIVYETNNVDFYKQKFGEDIIERPYGARVNFKIIETRVCPKCGRPVEIEDWAMAEDEGKAICPLHGAVSYIWGRILRLEIPSREKIAKTIAKQIAEEKGFKIEDLGVARGVEKTKTLEEAEFPSGIKIEIVEGVLVQYDLHAWVDGVNVVKKVLGKVHALQILFGPRLPCMNYCFVLEMKNKGGR